MKHAPTDTSLPLRAEDLSAGHGQALLSGLELSLQPGEMVAVVGPNGTGKTTLLHTLAGLLPPLSGRVLLQGDDVATLTPAARARRVALLPQVDQGDETVTVRELVELGRTPHLGLWGGMSRADRRAVDEALAACGIAELARRPLGEVSGGERQRARIALTLAQQSPLLLLDEPANHLDLRRRYDFFALLSHLRKGRNLAVLVVLHDLSDAFREADRILLLNDKRARLLDPADPNRKRTIAEAFCVPEEWVPIGNRK